MYVGIARPDNFQFMLAAEDLKISNAKGILRTTLENQPLQLWPHNLNQPSGCNKRKIKDLEEVLFQVRKEQMKSVFSAKVCLTALHQLFID